MKAEASPLGSTNLRGARVLVVDDVPMNRKMLGRMLKGRGYEVCEAESGEQALQRVEETMPALVLLDIGMPGIDGFETCRRLKASEDTHDIPVIFISAMDEVHDKVKAFTMGGVDYVTKPFQAEEVLARVETHLTICRLHEGLEERVAELDAFAHTVAHDVKSPLGTVMLAGELLETEADELSREKQLKMAKSIVRSTRKVARIVDELLLLATMRKSEHIQQEPLDMTAIIEEAEVRISRLIEEHAVEIILPPQWPESWGHAAWVEEVWTNYLSNAIKYGGRPPRVEFGATPQDDGQVRFWVRDNGAGISDDQKSALFAPFERLEQTRGAADGHGLGLSIVQRIVERLGGHVGVESTPGEGCCFYFTLNAAPFESTQSGDVATSGIPEDESCQSL